MALMRDAFINELFEQAKADKKIIFISADFGAAALDKFREELSNQSEMFKYKVSRYFNILRLKFKLIMVAILKFK